MRMTSRKSNGLTRRAPGSPTSEETVTNRTAQVISADPIAGGARMIRAEQHHPVGPLLVHAEHEHLASNRPDLPGGQVHDGDHTAPVSCPGV